MAVGLTVRGWRNGSLALLLVAWVHAWASTATLDAALVRAAGSPAALAAGGSALLASSLWAGGVLLRQFFGAVRSPEWHVLGEAANGALMNSVVYFVMGSPRLSGREAPVAALLLCAAALIAVAAAHALARARCAFEFDSGAAGAADRRGRLLAAIFLLLALDAAALRFLWPLRRASLAAWLLLNAALFAADAAEVAVRFALGHAEAELRAAGAPAPPNVAHLMLYVEFTAEAAKVAAVAGYTACFLLREPTSVPVHVLGTFLMSLKEVLTKKVAIENNQVLMRQLRKFPPPTAAQLATADACIVCREPLAAAAALTLPCGHLFHTSCMRSWFVQQKSCPTCRMDIVQEMSRRSGPNAVAAAAAAEAAMARRSRFRSPVGSPARPTHSTGTVPGTRGGASGGGASGGGANSGARGLADGSVTGAAPRGAAAAFASERGRPGHAGPGGDRRAVPLAFLFSRAAAVVAARLAPALAPGVDTDAEPDQRWRGDEVEGTPDLDRSAPVLDRRRAAQNTSVQLLATPAGESLRRTPGSACRASDQDRRARVLSREPRDSSQSSTGESGKESECLHFRLQMQLLEQLREFQHLLQVQADACTALAAALERRAD